MIVATRQHHFIDSGETTAGPNSLVFAPADRITGHGRVSGFGPSKHGAVGVARRLRPPSRS